MTFLSFETIPAHIKENHRIIGLDIGSKRVGIALSDFEATIATPHKIVFLEHLEHELTILIHEYQIGLIVVGLPLHMSGEESDSTTFVRKVAQFIASTTNLPVGLVDERCSTAAVTRALKDTGMRRKKRQAIDDKLAASYILQGVLDYYHQQKALQAYESN